MKKLLQIILIIQLLFFATYAGAQYWSLFMLVGDTIYTSIPNLNVDLGSGDFTTTGAITADSLSDGTLTITGGDLSTTGDGTFEDITINGNIKGEVAGDYIQISGGGFSAIRFNTSDGAGSNRERLVITGGLSQGIISICEADFSVDTDLFFVDLSEQKVGINDLSPSFTLDVNGDIRAIGMLTIDSAGTDYFAITNLSEGDILLVDSAGDLTVGGDILMQVNKKIYFPTNSDVGYIKGSSSGGKIEISPKADGSSYFRIASKITSNMDFGMGANTLTANKVEIYGTTRYIDRDGDNLRFTDPTAGTITLNTLNSKADYSFGANNFSGTGNFTTTGILEADTLTDGFLTINSGNLTTTGIGTFGTINMLVEGNKILFPDTSIGSSTGKIYQGDAGGADGLYLYIENDELGSVEKIILKTSFVETTGPLSVTGTITAGATTLTGLLEVASAGTDYFAITNLSEGDILLVDSAGDFNFGNVLLVNTTDGSVGINKVPTDFFGIDFEAVLPKTEIRLRSGKSADGGITTAGGRFFFYGGDSGDATNTSGSGGLFSMVAGKAGTVTNTTGGVGGLGGYFAISSGAGGAVAGATSSIAGAGNAGPINITSGTGGAASGTSNERSDGGDGGDFNLTSGTGGQAISIDGTANSGDGGDFIFRTGAGGFAYGGTASNTGNSGAIIFQIGGNNEIARFRSDQSGLRFLDDKAVFFGSSNDTSILFDGADLIINSEDITANDELLFTNFDAYVFDNIVDIQEINSSDTFDLTSADGTGTSDPNNVGREISVTSGAGSGGTTSTFIAAGAGGIFRLSSGEGGSVTVEPNGFGSGGTGGSYLISSADGGSVDGTSTGGGSGGNGGILLFTGGDGGSVDVTGATVGAGGTGGGFLLAAGKGGNHSTQTGGSGGTVTIVSGNFGTGGTVNGSKGKIEFKIGATGFDPVGTFPADGSGFQQDDNIKHMWGTTNTDLQIYSDGDNGIIDVNVALRLGNFETNYFQVAADGQVTLVGDAMVTNHVRAGASEWKRGGSAPGEAFVGSNYVLLFDSGSMEEAYFDIIAPFKMEAGSVLEVVVRWTHNVASTDVATWGIEWACLSEGDTLGGTTTTDTVSSGATVQREMEHTVFSTGITSCTSDDDVGVRLFRDGAGPEDDLAGDAEMVSVHFHYDQDKLGEPISP